MAKAGEYMPVGDGAVPGVSGGPRVAALTAALTAAMAFSSLAGFAVGALGPFLVDDFGQLAAQFAAIDIGEQQVHRAACRVFLTVRMVDQYLLQVLIDLAKPTLGGWRLQIQHGAPATFGRIVVIRSPIVKIQAKRGLT